MIIMLQLWSVIYTFINYWCRIFSNKNWDTQSKLKSLYLGGRDQEITVGGQLRQKLRDPHLNQ
jgi:hypothetical protein